MNLGFDIDEVVADLLTPTLEMINKKNNTSFQFEDVTNYNMSNVGIDNSHQFFQQNGKYLCDISLPLKHSDVFLKYLYNMGYSLNFITSRNYGNTVIPDLLNWLNRYNIHFNSVVGHVNNKKKIAKELNLDFYIDDCIKHVEEVKEVVPNTILYDKPYNQEYIGKKITNWKEIYKHIIDTSKW